MYVPLERVTLQAKEPDQIRLSLYAGPKDNHYAAIDRSLFREEGGQLVVTAVAALRSRAHARTVSFHIEEHTWLAADIELPASPGEAQTTWSPLEPMREARTSGTDAVNTDVQIRYRVVRDEQWHVLRDPDPRKRSPRCA